MSSNDFCRLLSNIVGANNVITDFHKTEFYRSGFRSGWGPALAVVFPITLLQQWQVLKTCVTHNKIIIMQAANTGLTEGSAPNGHDYDRDIVIINTTRLNKIILLDEGRQIIGFAGATLHSLEKVLKPLNRMPHSVIGSSCLGASIVGGVANNSGGALVKRGPAYTELALFARLDAEGELQLVNHLDIKGLGETPEEILNNLGNERFSSDDVQYSKRLASDRDYCQRVRDIEADSPSRFNADKNRLFEASGCAGKLAIFAVRLDTFSRARKEKVFYIGTNNPEELTQLRRDILAKFNNLPESAEYLHRQCFKVSEKYGKDTFLLIHYLGTEFMPVLFRAKALVDAYLNKLKWLPSHIIDRLLQCLTCFWPQHLPQSLRSFRDNYEHHLILKMTDAGIEEAYEYLKKSYASAANDGCTGFIVCNEKEAKAAYLHRFAAAGAAIRYQIMHNRTLGEVLALDIALKRNETQWQETLPVEISEHLDTAIYYGHFLCYVFHQDYILRKSANAEEVKESMLKILDKRGAKYPAEHNVGHLYEAENDLLKFYHELDPTNSFNPGIGKTKKVKATGLQ